MSDDNSLDLIHIPLQNPEKGVTVAVSGDEIMVDNKIKIFIPQKHMIGFMGVYENKFVIRFRPDIPYLKKGKSYGAFKTKSHGPARSEFKPVIVR